jgi:hypothetical protein
MTHNQQIKNWLKTFDNLSEIKSIKQRHRAACDLKHIANQYSGEAKNEQHDREWRQHVKKCNVLLAELTNKIENENKNAENSQVQTH